MLNLFVSMAMLFNMAGAIMQNFNLVNVFDFANSINIIYDNSTHTFSREDKEYDEIINAFYKIAEKSHEMPALGVSLHEDTVNEMQSGLFVEFVFDGTQIYNDMPFDALLIKVEKENTGFNIIRKYQDKYEGRCYYLQLNQDMQHLYDTLINLTLKNAE